MKILDEEGNEVARPTGEEIVTTRKAVVKDTSKAVEAHKRNAQMRRAIQDVLQSGKLDDLQTVAMENWAEALLSENEMVRILATKEVSKYLWSAKKDHQGLPDVIIQTNFNGIKDNRTISDLQEKVTELERKLKRYEKAE